MVIQCAGPDCRQSLAYSFIFTYRRHTLSAGCRDRTVTQGHCGTPVTIAGGLILTIKGVANELQTIWGGGARIGMAGPGAGLSTGDGRKEKGNKERYGAERYHL